MTDAIVRQADFVEGFLSTVKEHTDFVHKPFETIFGALGTAFLFRLNWLLGALAFVGEALGGYGPSIIGKYIDEYLLGTKKEGEADLSENNLLEAAKHAVDKILGRGTEETTAFLDEIFLIKHSVSMHDVVAAAYVMRDMKRSGIEVYAVKPVGMLNRAKTWLPQLAGSKHKIVSVLWWLLKKFSFGIIGMGIAGGLLSAVGVGKSSEVEEGKRKPEERPAPSGEPTATGKQYYTNVAGNVENTLITFLDAAIANFSTAFAKTVGEPLRGSARMKNVLQEVAQLNWANIGDVDRAKAFVAPSPIVLAKMLLPEAKYEPIGEESQTAAPKVAPKVAPQAPATSRTTRTTDPGTELKGLLQGVLT